MKQIQPQVIPRAVPRMPAAYPTIPNMPQHIGPGAAMTSPGAAKMGVPSGIMKPGAMPPSIKPGAMPPSIKPAEFMPKGAKLGPAAKMGYEASPFMPSGPASLNTEPIPRTGNASLNTEPIPRTGYTGLEQKAPGQGMGKVGVVDSFFMPKGGSPVGKVREAANMPSPEGGPSAPG